MKTMSDFLEMNGCQHGRTKMSGFEHWSKKSRCARLSHITLLTLLLLIFAQTGQAQMILMPGELYENIAAAGKIIANTGDQPAPPIEIASTTKLQSSSTVSFDRADNLTQNIRLFANVNPALLAKTAIARGILYVDFCVPVPGSGTCDSPPDPAAPDITASITFGYGVVGSVSALGLGAKATFAASGSVIDLDRSAYVNYQKLADLSASLGTVKVIAKIPIPIPDFTQAETTLPVTFTTLLKRGHTYRFQLAGASSAQGRIGSTAGSDFYGYATTSLQRGRVQLYNLTIQVGQDTSDLSNQLAELETLVASLQDQVGNLAGQIDTLRENFQGDTDALHQELEDLSKRVEIPGSFLMLPIGSAAPDGYAFIGNFDLAPSGRSRGRKAMMSVAVFWKGDPAQLPVRHHKKDKDD